MIVATAPGRCGILGNPTDMYGGSVISCTTQERARCEISDADALILEADDGTTQTVCTSADLAPREDRLDLARAVLRGMGIDPTRYAFRLRTSTEIPMQAGLAGSTALVAAVFGAVARQTGLSLPRHQMAEAIRAIEYREMGVICGFQDQYMTVFGGLNYMDFRDKGSHLDADAQPLATIEPLTEITDLPLVLAHTGVRHHSGAAHKPVRQRWLDGEQEVRDVYEELQILTRRTKTTLLEGNLQPLADAMNRNQEIQFHLGASGEACDRLIAVAKEAGAHAAKLAGAGHGGTIIALVPEGKDTVVNALKAAGAGSILFPTASLGLTIENQ